MTAVNAYILDGPHRGKICSVNPMPLPLTLILEDAYKEGRPAIVLSMGEGIRDFIPLTKSYTGYKLVPRAVKYYVECSQYEYNEWKWEKVPPGWEKQFDKFSKQDLRNFCRAQKRKFYRDYPTCYSTDGKWHQGAVKKFLQMYKFKKLAGEGVRVYGRWITKESLAGKSIDEMLQILPRS